MQSKRFRTRRRLVRSALAAAALVVVAGIPWSDSNAQTGPAYSIDFHVIRAAGKRVRNSCVILNGAVGDTAPGYSSGGFYSILAGFWAATPTVNDELFFDSFERC
jgi:hypothetical protein